MKDILVKELLEYFDIKLPYILRDEYEHDVLKGWLMDENMSAKECIVEASAEIEEYRTLFPSGRRAGGHYMTTVLELLIYLPMINKDILYDSLGRINGYMNGYFSYIMNQLDYLYRSIPESEMKSAADDLVRHLLCDDSFVMEAKHRRYAECLDRIINDVKETSYDVDFVKNYDKICI